MYQTFQLMPGVTLRCVEADRFKQGCLSIQFLRPMRQDEAAMNALIPSILLRGTVNRPNLRAITQHLDDLYGASVGEMVRRIGDYQAIGLYFGFIEDRFALSGDCIMDPILDFAKELLLEPLVDNDGFYPEYVAGEKRNLIANIDTQLNDKRAYTSAQLMKKMCSADSFGIPRLGTREQVEAIDPVTVYKHYQHLLTESPVEVFYVGSADHEVISNKIRHIFSGISRQPISLPIQTPFCDGGCGDYMETMEISQGKLAMGFITPITWKSSGFAAMQVLNALYGAGMTSKLFNQVREKMSLCYSISSGYYGAKGIMTVSAGIDSDKCELVKQEVLNQLQICCDGGITDAELAAAKESILSALRGVYDSPSAIESYEFVMAVGETALTTDEYREQIKAVDVTQVMAAAKTLTLHTTYFLKGVEA